MAIPPLPPLRIREADGDPNVIPVFDVILSNNLTLQKRGGGVVAISASTGAGGSSVVYAPTGGNYITFAADANLSNEKVLTASDNIVVTTNSTTFFVSAVTSNISGKQDSITFPLSITSGGTGRTTSGNYATLIGASAGLQYFAIQASDNVTIVNAGTSIFISAVTNAGGGSGTVNPGSAGNLAFYPSNGTTVDDVPQLYWTTADSQLTIGARTFTGATLLVTRGIPGGAQVDFQNLAGSDPVAIIENNSSNHNKFIFYTGSGKISGIEFYDSRSNTFSDAAGYFRYSHSADQFGIGTSGGATETVTIAKGRMGVGNPASVPSTDLVLGVSGSSQFTSIIKMSAQATSGGHAVRADRSLSTTYPLAGGGDLTANRTYTVDTAFLVNTGRTISTAVGLSGGGNLSADRTFVADTALLVTTGRTLTAGSGLSGGGNLSADRTFSVNLNVRTKQFGFFAAGNLSTAMLVEETRMYIPFHMDLSGVWIAATTAPTGQALIINPKLYNAALTASTAIFASANRPQVPASALAGSAFTFAYTTLHAGSWLGFDIDQVGNTNAGSNMTVNFVVMTS